MSEADGVKQFAWVLPGVGMKAGTLAAYAWDREQAHYSDGTLPSDQVWGGSKTLQVTVRYIGKNAGGYLMYEVSCGREAVVYLITGQS